MDTQKKKTILFIFLVIVMILNKDYNHLLCNFNKYHFRRIKNLAQSSPEQRIQAIFDKVVSEDKYRGSRLPPSFRKILSRLLQLGFPGAEAKIEAEIRRKLNNELFFLGDSRPLKEGEIDEAINLAYSQAFQIYQKHKKQLGQIAFPALEEFKAKILIHSPIASEELGSPAGQSVSLFDKIILYPEPFPGFSYQNDFLALVLVHELIQNIYPGWDIEFMLDEGFIEMLLQDDAPGLYKQPEWRAYQDIVANAERLAQIAGKEALIDSFAQGSFSPLEHKIGSKAVELFELTQLIYNLDPLSFLLSKWQSYGLKEDIIGEVLSALDSSQELSAIETKLLAILNDIMRLG